MPLVHLKQLQWAQIEVSLSKDENDPYVKIGTASWTVFTRMRFPGSDIFGVINQVDVIAEQKDGAGSSAVRIYDATNGNVIATISSISAAGFAIYSTTTVSNIPTGAAVFEVQAQKTSGEGRLSHVTLIRDDS